MYPVSLGPLALASVGSASNGVTVYMATTNFGAGVTTGCLIGARALVTGFSLQDGVNNSNPTDGFLVTANNSNTTITLANPVGVAETAPGSLYLFTEILVNSTANVSGYPQPNFGPSGPFGAGGTGPASGPGEWVPGAPRGASLTARGFFSSWNYSNSELGVQGFLAALTAARNGGTPWSVVSGFTPSAGKNVAQTTPGAPSGTYTQQGSPALTNVTSVTLSGFAPGTTSFVQFSGGYQAK